MKLDEVVKWYQKKIGTYDKQQWEKTVEQKILDGFSSVTLKNAKLKTELIDVDLVRGSTFPKAKPKQSLLTVIRLAILRYLFLPIYAQWWGRQTSPNTFALLLFLYITQMINWAVYTFNINRVDSSSNNNNNNSSSNINISSNINNNVTTNENVNFNIAKNAIEKGIEEHIVSLADLLIPMGLSLLLSLIHSQIVATNSISGVKSSKHRRFSNTNCNGKAAPKEASRTRRRKKLVKMRSQEMVDISSTSSNLLNPTSSQRKLTTATMKFNSAIENLSKPTSSKIVHVPLETTAAITTTVPNNNLTTQHYNTITTITNFNQNKEVSQRTTTPPILNHPQQSLSSKSQTITNASINNTSINSLKLKLDLNTISNINNGDGDITGPTNNKSIPSIYDSLAVSQQISNLNNKKRNVNWHSPIHNYAIETQEKQQQTSPQTTSSATITTTSSEATTPPSSSSSSSNDYQCKRITPKAVAAKSVRIDDCVQEFFDDLITRTVIVSSPLEASAPPFQEPDAQLAASSVATLNVKRNIGGGEDDGFESLNGKSSSGEETHSPMPLGGIDVVESNQLRLRLNAGDFHSSRVDKESENITKQQSNAMNYRRRTPISSESDDADNATAMQAKKNQQQQQKHVKLTDESSDETDEEGGVDAETISSPASIVNNSYNNECTTSATEWLGVTTNSEECSYSSELENSDYKKHNTMSEDDYDGYDLDFTPTTILNPHGTSADRISCTIWDHREIKKAQMSVLEISSCIIERVESMPETNDYIYIGIFFSFMLSLIPCFCRLCEATIDSGNPNEISYLDVPMLLWEKASFSFITILRFAFGHTQWERIVLIIGYIQRLCLTTILFIIFAVAERTFKHRFLYAKLFSHLTSSRRARKSNLPHFRLNKVRNIKTWLSVRSYLKKRGPQRSVDVIVSAAFIVTLLLLAFLSVEWLKDSVHMHSHLNLEALMWSTTIGIFLLRFMTLGNKIHEKYRSVSVLITEQINLYLQIEQKPKKKDELMVSNSVLKLAADLLKELETPFKISGLSANPYLFTTIKVVILSALSGVLSEMLGFKLKLHKIKIK